jgi:nitrite reductase (NADH) large subunit
LQGVVKLDNIDDAQRILKYCRSNRKAVVVGGGITALEIVEGLVSRGVSTTYFLRGERYWSNVLDEADPHRRASACRRWHPDLLSHQAG